jgi:hypothetical protein
LTLVLWSLKEGAVKYDMRQGYGVGFRAEGFGFMDMRQLIAVLTLNSKPYLNSKPFAHS